MWVCQAEGTSGSRLPAPASAIASNTTSRSTPRPYRLLTAIHCALPYERDRFSAQSTFARACHAIATNREFPSSCFDLLLAIKALSRYPGTFSQLEPLALPAFFYRPASASRLRAVDFHLPATSRKRSEAALNQRPYHLNAPLASARLRRTQLAPPTSRLRADHTWRARRRAA